MKLLGTHVKNTWFIACQAHLSIKHDYDELLNYTIIIIIFFQFKFLTYLLFSLFISFFIIN